MIQNIRYSMIFVRRGGKLLLLNRNRPANMGLWVGPGGKVENDETAHDGAVRELFEETGLELPNVELAGIMTWNMGKDRATMFVYFAEVPEHFDYIAPRITAEGVLDWKEFAWIVHPDNFGVAPHIKRFLNTLSHSPVLAEHRLLFRNYDLIDYQVCPLEQRP